MKIHISILLLIAAVILVTDSIAQIGITEKDLTRLGSQQTGSMGKINADASDLLNQMSSTSFTEKSMPIEGAIEPANYIVGPQ